LPAFIAALVLLLLAGNPLQDAGQYRPGQPGTNDDHTPKLLLNARLLRRLKRDRERQTQRWMNFERRVKTVPASPERGFELALYYAITGDQGSGHAATGWATAHPCEIRQVALITDWVRTPLPSGTKICKDDQLSELERLRNAAFLTIASGDRPSPSTHFIPEMTAAGFGNAGPLYAAIEYLDAIRSATREDLRQQSVRFFADLPALFLLSLPPKQLSDPSWKMHAAALALVSLDPNLEGSQFLQSWAMEESQTVQDGPGVAYELLWADPYLPGVSYRNMEPALYDEDRSRLIARTSWAEDACRIEIRPGYVHGESCPPDWQTRRMEFGHLSLIPMQERCIDVDVRPNSASTILWKMRPQTKLVYAEDGKQQSRNADDSGMWRVSAEFHGKLCMAK
jgi:hypothetical protein